MRKLSLSVLFAVACHGQGWELGAGGGYGLYRNASIIAPVGTAQAGFRNRFALTAFVVEDLYRWIAGEARYTYQDGDPFIQAGAVKANIQGQSHAFHYDLLFHTRPKEQRLRPYVAFGGGAKLYHVSGPANPTQPLASIGRLASVNEVTPLITAGAGFRFHLRKNVSLRLDFRDYITPFPKNVIRPGSLATARGFFHQFTPLIGVGMLF